MSGLYMRVVVPPTRHRAQEPDPEWDWLEGVALPPAAAQPMPHVPPSYSKSPPGMRFGGPDAASTPVSPAVPVSVGELASVGPSRKASGATTEASGASNPGSWYPKTATQPVAVAISVPAKNR